MNCFNYLSNGYYGYIVEFLFLKKTKRKKEEFKVLNITWNITWKGFAWGKKQNREDEGMEDRKKRAKA